MCRRPALSLFVVGALVVLAVLYSRGSTPERPPPADEPPASQPKAKSTKPVDVAAPTPVRDPLRPQEMLRYPDGTYLPALNGVKFPARVEWPTDRPFTPVVSKRITASGEEWYVHGDGSLSRSIMVWRSDLGREDSVCQILNALPPQPEEAPESRQK